MPAIESLVQSLKPDKSQQTGTQKVVERMFAGEPFNEFAPGFIDAYVKKRYAGYSTSEYDVVPIVGRDATPDNIEFLSSCNLLLRWQGLGIAGVSMRPENEGFTVTQIARVQPDGFFSPKTHTDPLLYQRLLLDVAAYLSHQAMLPEFRLIPADVHPSPFIRFIEETRAQYNGPAKGCGMKRKTPKTNLYIKYIRLHEPASKAVQRPRAREYLSKLSRS